MPERAGRDVGRLRQKQQLFLVTQPYSKYCAVARGLGVKLGDANTQTGVRVAVLASVG